MGVWIVVVGLSFTERWVTARDRAATLRPGRTPASVEAVEASARREIRTAALVHVAFGVAGVVLLSLADSWLRRRDRDLGRERSRMAAIFEATPDLLALKDRNLVYRSANPAFAAFVGRPVDQIVGRTDLDLFPEDHARRFQTEDRDVLESGQPRTADEVGPANSARRWLHAVRSPVLDPDGRIEGVLWSMRDVTERREAEAALARRDAILAVAQGGGDRFLRGHAWPEIVPEVLAEVGRAIDASRAYLFENHLSPEGSLLASQRYEWVAEGVTPQRANPLLQHASYAAYGLERWAASLRAAQPICASDFELPPAERAVLEAQGVRTMALLPIHAGDQWWGFIGFDECRRTRTWLPAEIDALRVLAQVIGACFERHRFETELRERERQQRLLVENLPAGVVIHDADTRIRFANGEARRFLGLTEADFTGATPPDRGWRFTREDGSAMPAAEHPVNIVRTTGLPARNLVFGLHLPGTTDRTWALANGYPIHDSDRRLRQIVITFVDVTEHRRLEERLQQSQKMDAVGQLAGGIAHDFNNILTATLMQLGQLREASRHVPEALELVRELEQGTQRAANLTRQLLLFSRKSVLHIQPIDLNELVGNLLTMLRRLLGETVVLDFRAAPGLPPVEADTSLVGQVILNLCVNARDAMPRGGRVTLATGLVELGPEQVPQGGDGRPGPFAWISVADTGCGIAPHVLPHIFEPFFTTKEIGKGTGLGLATVHGIVRQHRGWVEVDTEPDRGSTFRVFLPTARPAPDSGARPARREPAGGTETVLLVEDEPEVRSVVARCLRRQGYQVLEAGTAREALGTWSRHAPGIDLLFTDQVLPEGMTGLELAALLRRQRPDLRVILSSGYLPDSPSIPTAEEGAFLQFPKPYDLVALATAVREWLDAPPPVRGADQRPDSAPGRATGPT